MSRDKQIEEMADIITDAMMNGAENFVDCVVVAVEELVAKGYRKASEVAREIFEEIEEVVGYALCVDLTDWSAYTELKKKYTEEGK